MITHTGGTLHAQVITEDQTAKVQLFAQYGLDPVARKTGRCFIHLRIHDVGHHNGGQTGVNHAPERHHIPLCKIIITAFIDR